MLRRIIHFLTGSLLLSQALYLQFFFLNNECSNHTINSIIQYSLIIIMNKVILIASDQGKFQVEENVAKKSQLLKNMIEDTGVEEEIYLPNVKSAPLKKIIDFCQHYRNNDPPQIQKPLSKNSLKDLVDPWDQQFINLPNQEQLLELLLASNYLDIKALIELCCAKVATMIKGKSPQQIRQQFGIVNDFTPEEEAQIREQNKWAEQCTS